MRFARIDSAVDFPALTMCRRNDPNLYVVETHPFEPNKTKIPDFGMSNERSEIAVTGPFSRPNMGGVNILLRLLMEMATPLGCGGSASFFRPLRRDQKPSDGSFAS